MNLDDVKNRVTAIENVKDDDEDAHSREDSLHQDVLAWIAAAGQTGCITIAEAAALAEAALQTEGIDFWRWCA